MTCFAQKWRPVTFAVAIAVPLAAQIGLAGCAMGGMGDQLPHALGGLPEGAPARPTTPYQYPAVHDIPTSRPAKPLDDTGQLKFQKEMEALRDRQEKLTADPDAPPPKAATPAKKNAAAPKPGQASGAKTNP